MPLKVYLIIGVVVGTLLLAMGGALYYAGGRIETLAGDLREMKTKVATLETANAEMQADMERVRVATAELERLRTSARARAAIESRTTRQRDLAGGARANPTEMQRTVNEETAAAFRSLEEATR
jgi:outer membrane murein-binding lipoprotein Lpp